jgi:hypothetical protein
LGINRSHNIASPNPYSNVPDFAIMHTMDKMLMEYILMSCQVGGLLEEGMRNVNLELCSWQVATIFTFSYIFHQYTNGVFSSGRLAIWTPVHFKPKKDHLEKLKVYRGASHICQWKSVSYHSAHTSMFAWSSGWCWSTLPCNLNSSPSI